MARPAEVPISDPSIDDLAVADTNVRLLMNGLLTRVPSTASLDRALVAYDDPSPSMLEWHARWLDVIPTLRTVLSPTQLLQVCARACLGQYEGVMQVSPSDELLETIIDEHCAAVRPWLIAVRDEAIAGSVPASLLPLAATAAMHLGDPAPLRIVTYYARPRPMRALVERATAAERAAWVRELLGVAPMVKAHGKKAAGEYIGNRVARLLTVIDLCRDAECKAAIDEALTLMKAWPEHATTIADARAGKTPESPTRPTETAREAMAYLNARYASHRRGEALPGIARACASRAIEITGADELASVDQWRAAGAKRKRVIAALVAAALGDDFAVDEKSASLAAFLHAPSGVRFILVPGGTFAMGFSAAEEAVVRRSADAARGTGNFDEEYGMILAHLDDMRPVHDVRVAPLIVSEAPLGASAMTALATGKKARARKSPEAPDTFALAKIADVLERSPFRLLSEAEREWIARGASRGQLTPIDDEVPTEKTLTALAKPSGPFAMRELGALPEVCADTYASGYAKAPADASIVNGGGALVVRGGAGWLSPWQACGEWQLLCSGVRSTMGGWSDKAGVRLALGVRLTKRARKP